MTPSKAILLGSSIIALSIVVAALVLPERGMFSDKPGPITAESSAKVAGKIVSAPRFQIIKTELGRTWRLDTQTGDITVCHLQDNRMFCTSSALAAEMPEATPKQLEADRKENRQAEREERNEILDRFMGFFERIIKFAQKHAGQDETAPDDDRFKQL